MSFYVVKCTECGAVRGEGDLIVGMQHKNLSTFFSGAMKTAQPLEPQADFCHGVFREPLIEKVKK